MAHELGTCGLCGCPADGPKCRDHRQKAEVYTGKRKRANLVPDE